MDIFIALLVFLAVPLLIYIVYLLRSKHNQADIPQDAGLLKELELLRADKSKLEAEVKDLRDQLTDEQRKIAKAEEQVRLKDVAMENWEKHKKEFLEASKAAVMDSASQISSKLIKDHKSETDSARTLGEKKINDVSTNLQKHFDTLMKSITTFEERLGQQEGTVSILKRTLSEPAKIGAAGELILENSLKAAKLVKGQDFLLQESFNLEGSRLRPDAVVLLPDENVIIIDSKISSVLAELALAEENDNADEDILNKKLKDAMRNHLKSLTGKEYKTAVNVGISSKYRSFKPKQVITLMWVSTDGILERIYRADPEIFQIASNLEVLISGPSALQATITIAGMKVREQIHSENQSLIAKETDNLLKVVNTALGYAHKMGKNIQTAYGSYDKFASSVNTRLFPKARQIVKLGAAAPKGEFKTPLPRNQTMETIEFEEHEENEKNEGNEKHLIEIEIPDGLVGESQDD